MPDSTYPRTYKNRLGTTPNNMNPFKTMPDILLNKETASDEIQDILELELELEPESAFPVVVPATVEVEGEGRMDIEEIEEIDAVEKCAPEVADGIAEVVVSAALDPAKAEEGEETVPDPPAEVDNCAKPMAGVSLLEEAVPRRTV
ncbi:hypothetical protein HHX47_DHR3000410 [Lentinula edodes]|nr:hypothetical protein HHX47_DHR3000410 [Lentinula edodes]